MNILIVDDSRGMRVIIKRTLRKAELTIDELKDAGDGQEALKILEEFSPDVIISDWKMPNMDGFELLESVREKYNDLPFGFVTSQVSEQLRQEAEEAGVDFFITKPFTPEGLHSVLSPFTDDEE